MIASADALTAFAAGAAHATTVALDTEFMREKTYRAAGMSKLHPWRTAWSFLRYLLYLRCKLNLARAGIIVDR